MNTSNNPKPTTWQIHQDDCLNLLADLGPARLIFADPPYNIGVDYGVGAIADKLPQAQYLAWCARWLRLCADRLTDDGSLWVLIDNKYADHFGVMLRQAGLHRQHWIIWYETFGTYCRKKLNRSSRHLFHCTKHPTRFLFHREAVNCASDRQIRYLDKRANPGGKNWDDVWGITRKDGSGAIPRVCGTHKERIPGFPTQLPLALLRPIIGCASDPGDLVVDSFCGSATTGVAAVELGRSFIGIEMQPRFAQLARRRLTQVTTDSHRFKPGR
jgi:site-specific DNA-methyltransferase (adenine-specific)